MKAPKVMVVDDEPGILRAIGRLLMDTGWEVVPVDGGQAALTQLQSLDWDMIVADYHMPGIHGLKVLVEAKHRLPDAVRILMTGDDDREIIIKAVNEGHIFKYISKPWDPEAFVRLLEEGMHRKQLVDEERELMASILQRNSEWAGILNQLERRLIRLSEQGILALLKVIEVKDCELFRHSLKVAWLGDRIAEALKLRDADRRYLRLASLFHDIGKIAIRDSVLYKQGSLDEQERKQINHHAAIGAEILAELDFMDEVSTIVRQHHERYDGSGYPDGLKGEGIHFSARVLAVADMFVALREKRSYKPAYTPKEASDIVRRDSGRTLDPMIAAQALALMAETEIPEMDTVDREWIR